MSLFALSARSIPLDDGWDVIVVGGGPAGCAAAAASAREGARTLLIEQTGCLGGMGTNALVPAWTPFSDHEKIVYRGLAERVLNDPRKLVDLLRERAVGLSKTLENTAADAIDHLISFDKV